MEEIAKINYLQDRDFQLTKTNGGFLTLHISDKIYRRVMIQRAFPLSQPTKYLSVREVKEDREPGEEIGVIEDVTSLSEEKQKLICEELGRRYFTPDIVQIYKLKDEHGFVYMDAETTAGPRKITAYNNSASFIRLSKIRMLIIDVDGNRYNIPDLTALDKKSIRNLEVIV
jgi:hypothetical protein